MKGEQFLITRGALTTFSIANDVAKYFAIIPAMFVGDVPGAAGASTSWGLHTPGVGDPVGGDLQRDDHRRAGAARPARRQVQAASAAALLKRNLLIYGVGGVIAPFIGIKLVDLCSSTGLRLG